MRHKAGFGGLDFGNERQLELPAEEAANLDAAWGRFFDFTLSRHEGHSR
jgi:hypothetical protein